MTSKTGLWFLLLFSLTSNAHAQTRALQDTSFEQLSRNHGTRLLLGIEAGIPNIYERGAWASVRLPINPIHFSVTGQLRGGEVPAEESKLNISAALTADVLNSPLGLIELSLGPYYGFGMEVQDGAPPAGVGFSGEQTTSRGQFGFYSSLDFSHLTTERLGFGTALSIYTARASTFVGVSFHLIFLPG